MDLWQIDLNLLVVLDHVLETRNLTRAGRRLGRTQPAMSDALRRLRELLQDELLVRVGQSYQLTPRAEALVQPVREVLAQIERALGHREVFDPRTDRREFRLVCSDYVATVVLSPLLERLEREAPGIRLSMARVTRRSLSAVREGDADLLVAPEGMDSRLTSEYLFEDGWACLAWADHPGLAKRLTLKRYLAEPHLAVRFDDPWTSNADRQVEASGLSRQVHAHCDSFLLAPHLLAGTRMLVLVPARLGRRAAEALPVSTFAPPMPLDPVVEHMFYNPRYAADPGHLWLRDALRETVREIS